MSTKMKLVGPAGRPKKGDVVGPEVKKLVTETSRGGKTGTITGLKLSKAPTGTPIIMNQRMASRGSQSRIFKAEGAFDNSAEPKKRKKNTGHK